MHQLVFWNTVNFVGFSVIHVSQGSVATYVRCGGMSTKRYTANFQLSLPVKEFLKSAKIWLSYCQKFRGLVILEHGVDTAMLNRNIMQRHGLTSATATVLFSWTRTKTRTKKISNSFTRTRTRTIDVQKNEKWIRTKKITAELNKN